MFPFGNGYKANLYNDNKWNQAQPLLLSSHGRYIWSEQPFAFENNGKALVVSNSHGFILKGTSGLLLATAQYDTVGAITFKPVYLLHFLKNKWVLKV
jgi:alpha-glucosidase